eukprot:12841632-Ditylum_brightwellii.AAC.1
MILPNPHSGDSQQLAPGTSAVESYVRSKKLIHNRQNGTFTDSKTEAVFFPSASQPIESVNISLATKALGAMMPNISATHIYHCTSNNYCTWLPL